MKTKPTHARRLVRVKARQSLITCLKSLDLCLGKVKPAERPVEVYIYDDVQISIMTWV